MLDQEFTQDEDIKLRRGIVSHGLVFICSEGDGLQVEDHDTLFGVLNEALVQPYTAGPTLWESRIRAHIKRHNLSVGCHGR